MVDSRRLPLAERFPRAVFPISCVLFACVTAVLALTAYFTIRDFVNPSAEGHVGTAVATECGYQHGGLHCFGNFKSNDGQVSFTDVQIWGEDYASPGQTFTAYGDPATKMVVVAGPNERWSNVGGFLVVLLGWVLILIFLIYLPLKRRRIARRADPGGAGASAPRALIRHDAQPGRALRGVLLIGFILLTLFILLLVVGVIQEFRDQGSTSAAASGPDPWTALGVSLVLLVGDLALFVYGVYLPRKHRQAARLASDGATGRDRAGS